MKKLLIALFSVVVLVGCATKDENTPAYQIDPVATANARWQVGEKIDEFDCDPNPGLCYRVFLGITVDNKFLLQDFYLSGNKSTDPFLAFSPEFLEAMNDSSFAEVDGTIIGWHENGQKAAEAYYANGKLEGFMGLWYENGQRWLEGYFLNSRRIGVWRYWGEEGNLIREIDYGTSSPN